MPKRAIDPQPIGPPDRVKIRYRGKAVFRVFGFGDNEWFSSDWREVPKPLADALMSRFPGFEEHKPKHREEV